MCRIELRTEHGFLNGFVTDADSPELLEYLSGQTNLAKAIVHELTVANRRVAILSDLHVDPDFRKRGAGSELYSAFAERAEALGAECYLLVVGCEIEEWDLEGWYERRGFMRTQIEADTGPLMAKPSSFAAQLS